MNPIQPIAVQRLNHAVLFVSDLERAASFYERVFGFERIAQEGPMVFLRAKGSQNHHDLGLLGLGPRAPRPPQGSVGLYHLAWQVGTIQELASARELLIQEGAFVGESDHGATKSVYGADPDGAEFEVMVLLRREDWGAYDHGAPIMPLQWEKELQRDAGRKSKSSL